MIYLIVAVVPFLAMLLGFSIITRTKQGVVMGLLSGALWPVSAPLFYVIARN